jgi:hypothetical protein
MERAATCTYCDEWVQSFARCARLESLHRRRESRCMIDRRTLFLQMEPNKKQDSRAGFGRCVSEAVQGLN